MGGTIGRLIRVHHFSFFVIVIVVSCSKTKTVWCSAKKWGRMDDRGGALVSVNCCCCCCGLNREGSNATLMVSKKK